MQVVDLLRKLSDRRLVLEDEEKSLVTRELGIRVVQRGFKFYEGIDY